MSCSGAELLLHPWTAFASTALCQSGGGSREGLERFAGESQVIFQAYIVGLYARSQKSESRIYTVINTCMCSS